MELSMHVVEKVNAFFGSEGVVHRVPDGNDWVTTNCLEWKLSTFDLAIPQSSQFLTAVLEKVLHQISDKSLYTKTGYLNMDKYASRFKEAFEQQTSPEIQDELNTFTPKLLEFIKKQEDWKRTRKNTLKKVRKLLQDDSVIAYWLEIEWEGTIPETIVVAPVTDQFAILNIEQTNGVNYGILNEDIVSRLKLLDAEYGIDIIGVNSSGLGFVLKRIPKGKDAREFGKRLLKLCPDLYEAPRSFPKGKVSLWWD
jgi:hypothetical protein